MINIGDSFAIMPCNLASPRVDHVGGFKCNLNHVLAECSALPPGTQQKKEGNPRLIQGFFPPTALFCRMPCIMQMVVMRLFPSIALVLVRLGIFTSPFLGTAADYKIFEGPV